MTRDLQIIQQLQSKFGRYRFEYKVDNGKVTELELSFKELKNEDLELIGELIGELTSLKYLHLSCSLITEIQGLNKLVNLQKLDLSWNRITNLRSNRITEIQGLENLINLEDLALDFNKITKIKGLDGLTKLESLNLFSNEITEIQGLEKLANLQELHLLDNQISKIKGLDNLTKLKYISLYNNNIPEKEIKEFRAKHPKINV